MSQLKFEPQEEPYPRWMGPFSPARGDKTGFRFHDGRLGTWVDEGQDRAFWSIIDNPDVQVLSTLVKDKWHGGRVLFLPNGYVIKPLQDFDTGQRVIIGKFYGSIVLKRPGGKEFNLAKPDYTESGKIWMGPKSTGLECVINASGEVKCTWYHPTSSGKDTITSQLAGRNPELASGFKKSRPGDTGGRVRITANGHVITNRQEPNGTWISIYVGWIDPKSWTGWQIWIGGD